MFLINQILQFFRALFTSSAHKIEKYNKSNIDLDALIADYKAKAAKELKDANEKLDRYSAEIKLTSKEIEKLKNELNFTVESIKVASEIKNPSNEVINDIKFMKAKATNRLKLIDTQTNKLNALQNLVDELGNVICEAQTKYETNLSELEIAKINNTIIELDAKFDNVYGLEMGGLNVQEIVNVVEGKKALIEAKKENDVKYDRNDNVDKKYNQSDDAYLKQLEELLK